MEERLQKILSQAGIASRRKAEELIICGKIKVNGTIVKKLGTRADPNRDCIEIDGRRIPPPEHKLYLLLNKPKGYVTTLHDPEGRPKVTDLIKKISERLYPVGRLDFDTEGLLLLTNDGDFSLMFQHPRYQIARTYLVKIKGRVRDETVMKLQKGIYLDDGKTGFAQVRVLRVLEKNTWLEISIQEGKNRQIKRMFEAVGHQTLRIIRIGLGPFKLDKTLSPGSYRHLTKRELGFFKNHTVKSRGE